MRRARNEEVSNLLHFQNPTYWAATGRRRPVRCRRIRYYEHASDKLGMRGGKDEYHDARDGDYFSTRHGLTVEQSLPRRYGHQERLRLGPRVTPGIGRVHRAHAEGEEVHPAR